MLSEQTKEHTLIYMSPCPLPPPPQLPSFSPRFTQQVADYQGSRGGDASITACAGQDRARTAWIQVQC